MANTKDIGDFLLYNQETLNELVTNKPEFAVAFKKVIELLTSRQFVSTNQQSNSNDNVFGKNTIIDPSLYNRMIGFDLFKEASKHLIGLTFIRNKNVYYVSSLSKSKSFINYEYTITCVQVDELNKNSKKEFFQAQFNNLEFFMLVNDKNAYDSNLKVLNSTKKCQKDWPSGVMVSISYYLFTNYNTIDEFLYRSPYLSIYRRGYDDDILYIGNEIKLIGDTYFKDYTFATKNDLIIIDSLQISEFICSQEVIDHTGVELFLNVGIRSLFISYIGNYSSDDLSTVVGNCIVKDGLYYSNGSQNAPYLSNAVISSIEKNAKNKQFTLRQGIGSTSTSNNLYLNISNIYDYFERASQGNTTILNVKKSDQEPGANNASLLSIRDMYLITNFSEIYLQEITERNVFGFKELDFLKKLLEQVGENSLRQCFDDGIFTICKEDDVTKSKKVKFRDLLYDKEKLDDFVFLKFKKSKEFIRFTRFRDLVPCFTFRNLNIYKQHKTDIDNYIQKNTSNKSVYHILSRFGIIHNFQDYDFAFKLFRLDSNPTKKYFSIESITFNYENTGEVVNIEFYDNEKKQHVLFSTYELNTKFANYRYNKNIGPRYTINPSPMPLTLGDEYYAPRIIEGKIKTEIVEINKIELDNVTLKSLYMNNEKYKYYKVLQGYIPDQYNKLFRDDQEFEVPVFKMHNDNSSKIPYTYVIVLFNSEYLYMPENFLKENKVKLKLTNSNGYQKVVAFDYIENKWNTNYTNYTLFDPMILLNDYTYLNKIISESFESTPLKGKYVLTGKKKTPKAPNTTKAITTQNTFGLKIGDKIPGDILRLWCKKGENYYYNDPPPQVSKWEKITWDIQFSGERTVEFFEIIEGKMAFLVSETQDIYFKAEGFKEFLEEQSKVVTTQNTFGLKIDDDLPESIINKWAAKDKNIIILPNGWQKSMTGINFIGNRKIQKFEMLRSKMAFLVSGSSNVYLKAEGFKEFLEEQTNVIKHYVNYQNIKTKYIDDNKPGLTKNLNLETNQVSNNRQAPQQSASELKKLWENSIYEKELFNTLFEGNSGSYYKLNKSINGVWTWKKV